MSEQMTLAMRFISVCVCLPTDAVPLPLNYTEVLYVWGSFRLMIKGSCKRSLHMAVTQYSKTHVGSFDLPSEKAEERPSSQAVSVCLSLRQIPVISVSATAHLSLIDEGD